MYVGSKFIIITVDPQLHAVSSRLATRVGLLGGLGLRGSKIDPNIL